MAREVHSEKPRFRLAHRLCIVCACEVVWAVPEPTTAAAFTDDVIDLAMESHACHVAMPRTRGVWRSSR